jgi:hypothetical protein
MLRRRVRLDLVLAVVVVVALAAVLLFRGATAGSNGVPRSSPRATASSFGAAYAQYLDARRSPTGLPHATSRVEAIADSSSIIPAAARSGSLRITALALKYVSGASTAQAVLTARDQRHSYGFDLALAYAGTRWSVVYLVPPDIVTVLAGPRHRTPAQSGLQRAAARFALDYVGYRSGVASSAPGGQQTIRAQIAARQDPLAQISSSSARPSVVSLAFGPVQGNVVAATALVHDGGSHPRFTFLLARAGRQWEASSFLESGG